MLRDQIKSIRITVMIEYILTQKWKWAGLIVRIKDSKMNQALHRLAAKQRDKIKRTTKQMMAG